MAATPNPAWPVLADDIAVNVGAADFTTLPVWIGLGDRVKSRSFTMGRSFDLDRVEAGTAKYTVDNRDETLNPDNPTGPYAGLLVPYKRIRTTAMWPQTGNILNQTQSTALTPIPINWGSGASDFENTGHGWIAAGTTPPPGMGISTFVAFHGASSGQAQWPTGAGGESVSRYESPRLTSWWGLRVGFAYTWSIYVYVPTGVPAVGISVRGATVTAGTTVSSVNNTFQRLTATFVCTDPATNTLSVFPIGPTTSPQSAFIDAAQLELGPTASAYTTTGPHHYLLYYGYVEAWPTRWDNGGAYGWSDLTAVDELATIAQTKFVDAVLATRLTFNPLLVYPLTDESGSVAAGNVAPTQQPYLSRVQIGAGAGAQTFAVNTGPTGVAAPVANFAPASITNGLCLGATLSTPVTPNGGITLMAWFRSTSTPSAPAVLAALWNGVSDYAKLVLGTDGGIYGRILVPGGTEVVSPGTTNGPWNDGQWHQASLVLNYGGAPVTATITVDTTVLATVNVTGPIASAFASLYAGGVPKGGAYSGDLCYVTAYGAQPNLTGDLYHAGADGFAGDFGYQRVQRLLGWSGHPNVSVLADPATTLQGAQVHNGKAILQAIQDVADTDGGALWVANAGLKYADRNYWFTQTSSSVVFGENTAGGEIPYEDGIGFSKDPAYVYNDVALSRQNGITTHVSDAASQAAYFPRTYPLTVYSQFDADVADHANYLLYKYGNAANRVQALEVESAARPSAYPSVLQELFGTRVTVNRRLSNGQLQTADHFIDQITRDISDSSWRTTYRPAPAAGSTFFVVGSSLVGTGVLGW
jgi:Concanavalin A-like lectin/glucanases superfamily